MSRKRKSRKKPIFAATFLDIGRTENKQIAVFRGTLETFDKDNSYHFYKFSRKNWNNLAKAGASVGNVQTSSTPWGKVQMNFDREGASS